MTALPLPLPSHLHPPADGQPARAAVILLHGLGSNGADLITLAPHWARSLPHAVFLSPDAPNAYDMAEVPGARQWFSLANRDHAAMVAGLEACAPQFEHYLDAVASLYGLTNRQIALAGFSQGTMMALHAGQRRTPALAAIIGFSGVLLAPHPAPQRPPVLLVHGMQDQVVPFSALQASQTALEHSQTPVEVLQCPGLGHSIDEAGISRAARFLALHLPR